MRFRIWLLLGLCLLAGVAATHRAYLPAIGPAPLRFLAHKPPAGVYVLPPLEIPTIAATNDAVQAILPAAEKTTSIEPLVTQGGQASHSSTNTTPEILQSLISEPFPSLDTATNELSMQALVNFFKHGQGGTNQIDTGVFFPLNFVPPRPVAPPASTATYTSP
ncbi:MAG: hypothetical protein ABI651_04770 [Verrucomicrobiota bacterium]